MIAEERIVGTSESITFPQFNKSITAKVDTGATTCCLHANNITVDSRSRKVSFSCPDLSANVLSLPLVSVVEVRSADHGGDNRPVVELDVVFGGQQFSNVQFNLNDRSEMDAKVLIGENLLKQGKFAVKVTETEQPDTVESEPAPAEINPAVVRSVQIDPTTMECVIKLDLSQLNPK